MIAVVFLCIYICWQLTDDRWQLTDIVTLPWGSTMWVCMYLYLYLGVFVFVVFCRSLTEDLRKVSLQTVPPTPSHVHVFKSIWLLFLEQSLIYVEKTKLTDSASLPLPWMRQGSVYLCVFLFVFVFGCICTYCILSYLDCCVLRKPSWQTVPPSPSHEAAQCGGETDKLFPSNAVAHLLLSNCCFCFC